MIEIGNNEAYKLIAVLKNAEEACSVADYESYCPGNSNFLETKKHLRESIEYLKRKLPNYIEKDNG